MINTRLPVRFRTSFLDYLNFPVFLLYHYFALDGPYDWVDEQPELRQLYDQALQAVDLEQQQSQARHARHPIPPRPQSCGRG